MTTPRPPTVPNLAPQTSALAVPSSRRRLLKRAMYVTPTVALIGLLPQVSLGRSGRVQRPVQTKAPKTKPPKWGRGAAQRVAHSLAPQVLPPATTPTPDQQAIDTTGAGPGSRTAVLVWRPFFVPFGSGYA